MRASVELARGGGAAGAWEALRAGRGHPGGTRGGATRGCDPGAGPRRRARRLPRARERWGGLQGGGEGFVALLVPGPPRSAPPGGEGSRACKHGLACWALWRAASGAQSPEVTAAAEELERRHSEAPAGETRAA